MKDYRPEEYKTLYPVSDAKRVQLEQMTTTVLHIERGIVFDKLESIEDGTYYQRDSFVVGERYTARISDRPLSNTSKLTEYLLDVAPLYNLLYEIDCILERRDLNSA